MSPEPTTFGGANYLLLTGNGNVSDSQLSLLTAELILLGKTVHSSAGFDASTIGGYDVSGVSADETD